MRLNVNGEELANVKSEVDKLLIEFNSESDLFYQKLNELGNYWIGEDYVAMKNSVENGLKPLINKDSGSIPQLMRSISDELERKNAAYEDIQKRNISRWE